MQFSDTLPMNTVKRTQDGYLVANSCVARSGIQTYAGHEIDPDNMHGLRDRASISVYRPHEEIFAKSAMQSYAHRPITNDHPPEMVDAENWKKYAIGQTSDEITRDGESIRVPLMIMDKSAINDVLNGKRELSMGYSAQLVFENGTTDEGEPYQVKQTNLRMNHLAVVAAARGGATLRIGDKKQTRKPFMKTKRKSYDQENADLEEQENVVFTIEELQQKLNQAIVKLHEKDATIARLDAKIEELENNQGQSELSETEQTEAFDVRVNTRAELIMRAKLIDSNVKTFGLQNSDIRRLVVTNKLGRPAVQSKTQSYIDARFDILAEEALKAAESELALRANLIRPNAQFDQSYNRPGANERKAHAAMVARLHKK